MKVDKLKKKIPKKARDILTEKEEIIIAYGILKEIVKGKKNIKLQKALENSWNEIGYDEETYSNIILNFGKYYNKVYNSLRYALSEIFKEDKNNIEAFDPVTKTLFLNLTSDEVKVDLKKVAPEVLTNTLVVVDAIVTSVSRRVESVGGIYRCPKCGNEFKFVVDPVKIRSKNNPECPECGNQAKVVSPLTATRVEVEVQEPVEKYSTDPARIKAVVRYPLNIMVRLNPGDRVRLTCIPKPELEIGRIGEIGEMVLEVCGIEEKRRFKLVAQTEPVKLQDPISQVKKVIAPDLVGEHFDFIREIVTLQLFSMVDDIGKDRDRIHVLLVGDPGSGKSKVLQSAAEIYGIYVSAEHVTGAGLTIAAERDKGGWKLRAGAAIIADKSLLAIDEIDKASKDDLNYLLELMESGKASIAKAGITSEIKSAVTVLAAANTKQPTLSESLARAAQELGYSSYEEAIKDIGYRTLTIAATNITSPLASRFDIIIPVTYPTRDPEFYTKIVLKNEEQKPDDKLIKKVKSYVYKAITEYEKVTLPESLEDYVYKKLSKLLENIDFSPRMATTISRLAKANARAHLRNKVNRKDINKAFNIIEKTTLGEGDEAVALHNIEVEKEIIKTGNKKKRLSKQDKRNIVLKKIRESGPITKEELVEDLPPEISREELEEILDDLVDSGEVIMPRPGEYQAI